MSAHTPGPWTVAYDEEGEIAWVYPESVIENWPEGAIAEDHFLALGGLAYKERAANLHLIAAAPELLAVLKDMTDLAVGPPAGVRLQQKKDIVARAFAAIAKADGR